MPQLESWMEVHGNGPGERVLRFRTVDRGPVYKKCYTVSVDGAFNIALTPEGKAHIGYYWEEAEEALQTAVAEAMSVITSADNTPYCEINDEPQDCIKRAGLGEETVDIEDHPLPGAHWVQATAYAYLGNTYSPGDALCDPENTTEEAQYPRLEVQVTAPTYPGVDFKPILEFFRAQTYPTISEFDLQQTMNDLLDAALALPRSSLVRSPDDSSTVTLNTDTIPGATSGLIVTLVAGSESSSVSVSVVEPGGPGFATFAATYMSHSGDLYGAFADLGSNVELYTLDSEAVYPGMSIHPTNFMPSTFVIQCSDGTEDVGFKEVFELIPTGDGNWEMKPSTGLVPNPTSYYYHLWTDDDGNPQMWTSRSLPAYSAMSGTMSLALDFKSHETIDPGDNPKCRLNLFYKRKEPINDQCEIQWFSWFEHPETVVSPGMQVACRVPYRNKPPEPEESA